MKINFYTVNTDFLINLNPVQLGGFSHFYTIKDICIKSLLSIVMYHIDFLINPLWFVKVLFFISVFYAIVGFIIYKFFPKQKEKIMMLLALLSLFIGFFMFKKHFKFYNIDLIFSYVFLYHLGYLWKKYEYRIKSSVFLTSVILLIIYYFTFPNTILYSANKYQNPIVLILLSTCVFFATIFVSQCINNYCFLKKIIIYIGQHTMSILIFHMTFFKLITALQVKIYNLQPYNLAYTYGLYTSHFWWLTYLIIGIIGPLMLNFIYTKTSLIVNKNQKV